MRTKFSTKHAQFFPQPISFFYRQFREFSTKFGLLNFSTICGKLNLHKILDTTQEKYKASLKTSTSALYLKLKQMDQLIRKGRRIVKNEMPQVRWVEFGIKAIR